MIAALYVETDGAYMGLPGVDPWDEPRDARKYAGPHPVVAHPPCQRWGRFWPYVNKTTGAMWIGWLACATTNLVDGLHDGGNPR